jgi:hypothetical protein
VRLTEADLALVTMTARPTVKIPRSVEALERVWRAIPVACAWWWIQTGELPSLAETMDALESAVTEP